ncbi:hypothetical protein BS50DRAFT_571263 [Corynespora cassiicola Philippines]|uniref:37S ribosomal protein-like protein Rsm22 n=1 Tax=Corynespora cassiicola Philippines TaxID=1448308 RepID=A0A2T2NWY8_CORCC|nr:hypothetical protein BS50DRAFT_571263 [Corynespora cassiicola Philippines]
MLTTRSFRSICLPCRISLLSSQARHAALPQATAHLARSQYPRVSAALSRSQHLSQRRNLSTTIARRQQTPQNATSTPPSDQDDHLPSTPADRLSIEVAVRHARQRFGDSLPRGYLSEEELVVYERLFGSPTIVEPGAEVEEGLEEEGDEIEIFEQEMGDGRTAYFIKNEDGHLEEVEIEAVDEGLVEGEAALMLEEEGDEVEAAEEKEPESMTREEYEEYKEMKSKSYHDDVYEQSRLAREELLEQAEEEEDDDFMRAHPLTIAGRSKGSPSTVFLPKETLVDPTSLLLTRANPKHLAESANRMFGGPGLPYSATTASARLGKEQKPIPLDPSQSDMGNIEADTYMASVQPGTYASVMSALVEVRRRLGTGWMERILQKKGGNVLDAGSGGVGILAWHEILKAEWDRTHDESGSTSRSDAPLGKATVLTASDTLRHRASRLLENTTFIPRLPEMAEPVVDELNTAQPRKLYDLIIAPHTLWPLKQEYLRKEQVEKYWSLLNPKGGVLIMIEKGLPKGFEVIAGARELLLDRHIASPDSPNREISVEEQVSKPAEETRFAEKETGMIIAPCTNHSTCPMYQSPGHSPGRKDFCYFSQRYIRPPYLQRILNAKDRNHEDVQFSYLAVQRGRDQRLPLHDPIGKGVVQNDKSTDEAFAGHEWNANDELRTPADVNTLTLPRLILPALKRRGHIILDVCTPAGSLERWTVPKSFSRQAFRDARKAQWGDLWALGAKTRIPKNVRLGRPRDEFDKKGRRIKAPKGKMVIEVDVGGETSGESRVKSDGRRYTNDRKIRGSGGRKGRKRDLHKELERDVLGVD